MRHPFRLLKSTLILLTCNLCAGTPEELPSASPRPESEHNLYAMFDVLYWHATENTNWSQTLTGGVPPSEVDFHAVSFGWDPGIRAGLGYKFNYDNWDTQFCYTWFHTSATDSVSTNSGEVLSIFIGAGLSIAAIYKSASIKWNIDFNMFDWDLGCNVRVSEGLSLRPFIGVKGGWINQSLRTHWENPDFPGLDTVLIADENLKNNFWGVGPRVGANGKWNFVYAGKNSFGLFGDFQGAFLWGHWSFKDSFHNNLPEDIPSFIESKDLGTLMFGALMGLSWDVAFNRDRFHFTTRLGYEIQDWINQYQIFEVANGANKKSLYLQGAVLDLRFDF